MKIYIDNDFKCHTVNDGTMRSAESELFDGKCPAFIEGYRFVPAGETWVREDGVEFKGEMAAPWRPYDQLAEIQNAVDFNDAARDLELAELIEEIYQEDLGMIDE